MPAGRPSDYTPEIAETICEWLAGGQSLRAFCRKDNTPDISTITRWIVRNDKFRVQYMQAREAAGFAHADGIIETVELVRDGEIDGQTGRAMMDGLKWAAERMAPKTHSQKTQTDLTSSDGTMSPKGLDVSKLSESALRELANLDPDE